MHDTSPDGDLQCRERALSSVRTAIAALEDVPAIALDAEKHDTLQDSADDLESLERSLTNEVDQLREDGDSDE